jgi:hypothetical protein
MNYEKPRITTAAAAVAIIQSLKPNGVMEVAEPQNPIHSSSAYQSDE